MIRVFSLILVFVFQLHGLSIAQTFKLSGQVLSEGEPLIGATVLIHELKKTTSTGLNGQFEFPNLKPGAYHVHITYVGYQSEDRSFRISQEDVHLKISMKESSIELKEITVEANPYKSGPIEQSQTIKVVDREFFEQNLGNSFVNSLEKIPGVNSINTGVGIAKPVIRGMSFNRIMVNDHGIKQEGQQWGADHGLEIDMFDVDRVEIIKGPASLMYGSDGLGGVININSVSFPKENTFRVGAKGIYKSNNNLRGTSLFAESNRNGYFVKGRFSTQDFDNYRVPAEQFNYGSFIIPISDNTLRNTAGQERNFSLTTGLNRNWGYSSITLSRFHQRVGLFPGAVGRPTAYVLNQYDPNASIDFPRQNNQHWKVISNTNLLINQNWLEIDLGYQYNIRREESRPHLHNVGDTEDGNLALGLDLRTFTANTRYHSKINGKWKGIHGVQMQYMMNEHSGFEFLLPTYQSSLAGVFSYLEYTQYEKLVLNAGLRYDWGMHNIQRHEQAVYRNLLPTGEYQIRNDSINRTFNNASASVGMSWLPSDKVNVKLNIGSSFRIPTAIELSSNGIHHGSFRHELGNPSLSSERGMQGDINITYSGKDFYVAFTPYYSHFLNYIYLAPTANFTRLPSGNQLTWEYRETQARFYGAELEMEYHLLPTLHLGMSGEYVRTFNLVSRLPLPLTPPASLLTEIEYTRNPNSKWIDRLYVSYYLRLTDAQNRVDRNERTTEGFTIMGASLGTEVELWQQKIHLRVAAENLTNKAYFNHLSRYRLLNLPEQGRNVIISLSIPIEGNYR